MPQDERGHHSRGLAQDLALIQIAVGVSAPAARAGVPVILRLAQGLPIPVAVQKQRPLRALELLAKQR